MRNDVEEVLQDDDDKMRRSSKDNSLQDIESLIQKRILIVRCLNLIVNNVPHCSSYLCSEQHINLTHHLFAGFLKGIISVGGNLHQETSVLSKIVNMEAFERRESCAELFEEWVTCLESVASQQAEKICLSNVLKLLCDLKGLTRLPLRIQLKILNVLGLVIQRQKNAATGAQRRIVCTMTQIIEQLWRLIREEILPPSSEAQSDADTSSASGDSERLVSAICDCFAFLIDGFKHDEKMMLQIAETRATTDDDSQMVSSSSSNSDSREATISAESSAHAMSLVSQLIDLLPLQQERVENQSKILKVLIMLCSASRRIASYASTTVNLKILLSCLVGSGSDKSNSALLQMSQTQLMDAFNADPHADSTPQNDILLLLQEILPNALHTQVYNVKANPVHSWSWEDDYHNKNPFDAFSSQQLERGYSEKKDKIVVLRRYEVIFSEMKQYNVQTRLQRSVHRTPLPQSFERGTPQAAEFDTKDASPATSPSSQKAHLPPSQCTRSKTKRRITRKPQSLSKDDSSDTQTHTVPLERLTSENDLRVNRLHNDDELVVFISRNVVLCLMQLFENSTMLSVKQDVAQILSSIFMYCKKDIVSENVSLNNLMGFTARMLSGNSSLDPDLVIASHAVYLMKRSFSIFNLHQVQTALLKHGVDKIIGKIVQSHAAAPGNIAPASAAIQILKHFHETHLKSIQHTTSEEEQLLELFCTDLKNGNAIDLHLLTKIFADNQAISDHFFQQSDFVESLMEQLYSRPETPRMERVMSFMELLMEHREVLKTLLHLVHSQVNSLQNFTDTSNESDDVSLLSGFSGNDSVAALQDAMAFDFAPFSHIEQDALGEITNPSELTFDPMCTVREVKQFLLGKFTPKEKTTHSVDDFDLFAEERQLSDQHLILQVAFEKSKPEVEEGTPADYYSLWSDSYTLTYRLKTHRLNSSVSRPPLPAKRFHNDIIINQADYLSSRLRNSLCFLRLLSDINQNWHEHCNPSSIVLDKSPLVDPSLFHNSLLSSKLRNQVRSPYSFMLCAINTLPLWTKLLTEECSFLFPFSTKQLFFYYQQFGAQRALCSSLPLLKQEDYPNRCVHHTIERVTIQNRHSIFAEAQSIMKKYAGTRTVLEIEYEGEAGIGVGPTLEFYNLTSIEFQLLDKVMWQSVDDNNAPFIHAPKGLFPCHLPSDPNEKQKLLERFEFLGQFIGKALEDHRLVDLPLSHAFVKLLLGQSLSLSDLRLFEDDVLCQSVEAVCQMRNQKHSIHSDATLDAQQRESKLQTLNEKIEGTYLTFSFRDVDLIDNGADVDLNIENIDKYVEKLTQYLLVDSSKVQVQAVHKGLCRVLNLSALQTFSVPEFLKLLCGEQELWKERSQIENNIQFTGYTLGCKPVQWLIELMMSLNKEGQRNFLEFTTGATNLPVGGLSALKPKLTIVKSMVRRNRKPDDMLPSCNTCFHNLKLPEYSSKEILVAKCRMALTHGRYSFDLT